MNPQNLLIEEFNYDLLLERIAIHPLASRDQSKLLVWKEGKIKEDHYFNLADHLPANSLLLFNDTKVIPARMLFTKSTGAIVEIFCLEPYQTDYNSIMNCTSCCLWKCMIGGASKWKGGVLTKRIVIAGQEFLFTARLIEKLPGAYVTEFSWNPANYTFAEIIQEAGIIPLPPYIKRMVETEDTDRYQTIYATYEGSVAAPTAGLHFTERIFSSLMKKNIKHEFITLHVGAGTFKPVKAAKMDEHVMHAEWLEISINAIEKIIENQGNIIAVGTTSLRSLESLYWMGVKCSNNPAIDISALSIQQWEVYEQPLRASVFSLSSALLSLLKWMKRNDRQKLMIQTSILIAPGYTFRVINALITNFHQPGSTLLLLVAAIMGNQWKSVYEYAMEHNFRFLSYGDGCLLFL